MARQYKTGLIITGDASGGIKAVRATEKELGQLNQRFDRGTQRARAFREESDNAGTSLGVVRNMAVAAGGAIATAFAAQNIAGQARMIAETDALARSIGVATSTLQAWGYAGEQVGLQSDKMGDIFKDVSDKLGDFARTGGGEAADLIEQMGLNVQKLLRLSPDQQLLKIGEALEGLSDSEATFFLESLGDEAVRLRPLLANNAAQLREYADEARALGVAMDEGAIAGAVEADRAMRQMQGAVTGLTNQLAADLGPGLASTARSLTDLIQSAGGASAILEQMVNVGQVLATVYGARLVTSLAAKTTAMVRDTAASVAAAQAEQVATQAATRRAAAELYAEKRLLGRAMAEARATAGTDAHTAALARLGVARQRTVAASVAHTQAVNANAAAMTRATAVARGFSGALALVGGPAGAAILAGAAIFAFRDELGLTVPKIDANTTAVNKLTGALDDMSRAEANLTLTRLVGQLAEVRAAAEGTSEALQEASRPDDGLGEGLGGGYLGISGREFSRQTQELREVGAAAGETRQEAVNLEAAIALVADRLGELDREATSTEPTVTKVGDAAREAAKAAKEQADALEALRREMDPLRAEHAAYTDRLSVLNQALAEGAVGQQEYGEAVRWAAQQYVRAATGAEEYEKQQKSLVAQYDRHHQKAQQLREDLAAINEMYRRGDIDGDTYSRMIANVRDEMRQLALDADPFAQDMARAWEEASNRIDETFANAFAGAFDSFDDFADQLLDGFKRLLAELAYQATLKPIVVGFTSDMQGSGPMQGGLSSLMGGQGGGFGGLFSAGKSLLTGGLGSVAWTGVPTSYAGGWAGSATAGMGTTGGSSFLGGSMRNFGGATGLASGVAGMGGTWLGSQMFGEGEHSSTLGTLGGIAGTFLGGPVGALVGSTLGGALGGIFGGSWETKDMGLNLGVGSGSIRGNRWERQKKDGGWFSSSKSRTKTSALPGDLRSSLQEVYDATEASLAATIETLGYQEQALSGFATGLTKISTKGKGEQEIQEAIERWLEGTLENLALHAVGDVSRFAASGENTRQTLERLALALQSVNPALDRLHDVTLDASLSGGDAASHLAQMAGGIEAFADRANYYYQNIITEEERRQNALDDAARAMGRFTARTGEVVRSTDALRDLVDGIDLTTEAGRHLYNEAMNLAPALVEIESGLERVRGQFDEMLADAESAISDAEQQARRAWQAFDKQSFSQQITLLEMLGESEEVLALQRERELLSIDPLLHETQRRIWALQDEAAAQQEAAQAAQAYQRELSSLRSQLDGILSGIGQWVDTQRATGQSPGNNLTAAGDQFARQLARAEGGDRDALQSITQYADQYLAAGRDMYASGSGFQRIEQDVIDALESLPEATSAEEYLAEEIRAALHEAVDNLPGGIGAALHPMFDSLDSSLDGLIDYAEFASAFEGMATDAQLRELFDMLDRNGDGTISAIEAGNFSSEEIDENTKSLEERSLEQLVELNRLIEETARTTDQFSGLNSTMTSLKDAINALGVAQEEAARIERERHAAEIKAMGQTEKDRLEAARSSAIERRNTLSSQVRSLSNTQDRTSDYGNRNVEQAFFDKAVRAPHWEKAMWDSSYDYYYQGSEKVWRKDWAEIFDAARAYRSRESKLDRLEKQLADARNSIPSLNSQKLKDLRADYRDLMGEPAPFALGGIFTNGIVTEPTGFNMGLMGEAGPEAIMPLHRGGDGSLGIRAEMPPLLGGNDVIEVLQDLRREVAQLRRENAQLQGEGNKHAAASVQVQQAGFQRAIAASERGNQHLDDMARAARLEAAR